MITELLDAPSVLNIAHRGARSVAPENTLAAARKASEFGADLWEVDVAMSADGVLYLIHDDTLARTSNVAKLFPQRAPWPTHAFTWAELHSLDFGSWFVREDPFGQIAAGKVTEAEQASFVGERAPSLEEALRFTREQAWLINVELKDLSGTPGDAEVVERAVALIERLDMVERVLLSSFNHGYLERVKRANPAIATGALVAAADDDPAALLARLAAQAYHPGVFAIRPDNIPSLRAAGVPVLVWTVNEKATMQTFIRRGVSGLFTDFPQRLARLLTE